MKKEKINKINIVFIFIALLIATPIYMSQYREVYQNHENRRAISVEGVILD